MYEADDKIIWKNINKDDEEEVMELSCAEDAETVATAFNTLTVVRNSITNYLAPDNNTPETEVFDEILVLMDGPKVTELFKMLES